MVVLLLLQLQDLQVLSPLIKSSLYLLADLPTKSVSDFSYTKLEKVTKSVSNSEVSISVPNNFTPLATGFLITSSTGTHTATATVSGQTLVLSSISGTPSSVDVYYKLRVNNTSIKEKEPKRYNFLSAKNAKGTNFTVYGNRFDDKEINLKIPRRLQSTRYS